MVLGVQARSGDSDSTERLTDRSGTLLTAMVRSSAPTIETPARPRVTPPSRPAPAPAQPDPMADAFATLVRLNRTIVDEPDLDVVLESLVSTAVTLCGAERGFLALFGDDSDDVHVLATQGLDAVEGGASGSRAAARSRPPRPGCWS